MTQSEQLWPYWDVDVPGLTKAQAQLISDFVEESGIGGRGAIICDPTVALTLRLDRPTVETLRRAVKAALLAEHNHVEVATLQGLAEDFDEWLAGD